VVTYEIRGALSEEIQEIYAAFAQSFQKASLAWQIVEYNACLALRACRPRLKAEEAGVVHASNPEDQLSAHVTAVGWSLSFWWECYLQCSSLHFSCRIPQFFTHCGTAGMQSPGQEFVIGKLGAIHTKKRIMLLRHAATVSTEESLLPDSVDEPCSALGEVQAIKLGEFLMDTRIDTLLVSPAERAVYTASAVAKCQSLVGDRAPRLQLQDDLANLDIGQFAGMQASEVCSLVDNLAHEVQKCAGPVSKVIIRPPCMHQANVSASC
jgi:hypothetical protein